MVVSDGINDLRKFLFFHGNIFRSSSTVPKKALTLLRHLDWVARDLFYDKYGSSGELVDEAKDYPIV